ncbi:asparagine synthase-related protein [Streptomyces profundus]|uniref:asparagine synthase-related protein n=1 Tax=Streptomyces profundus TaxID=2867410 RepID=UPI001D16A301|nr:asparagine synthase-related protein [Streptomyces sp. MA3_2.13]UED85402.1 asparagine synthetase B family protein [Streptomyces sp. MA3_2.13]
MGHSVGGRWFVVLPDHEAASAVFERVRNAGCQVVRHASGRPWLAGCWEASAARLAEAGDVRLVVLGVSTLDTERLRGRARAVRAISDVETAVRGSAGDHFLLASVAGRVYARGTASGSRRLYRAEVDGVTVVADRARTLARFTGATVDLRQVASRLVSVATPPFPLDQASFFDGVRAVPPGQAVLLERAGEAAERRWWQPPESELPLAEGAEGLREALLAAVRARVAPGRRWAADLSGGMDSTSLCFLAAEAGAELVTLTLDPGAPGDEDVAYARRAAAGLPSDTPHLVFDATALPSYYTGLDEGEPEDEPTLGIRDRAQQEHLAGVAHAYGVKRRLCGQGGDQLVIPPPSYLHDLVRREPRRATRQLAAYAAKERWPRTATLRALADRRPFGAWLTAEAGRVTGDHGPAGDVRLGWGLAMSLPHWATDRARESTAGLLREAATRTQPLADTRGRHLWLYMAQQSGRVALLYDRLGIALDMPFCDDAVVEACLRVRPHEATTPWAYKPLLATAMRGIVPQPLLDRTTKGNATPEWHRGMRVHQRTLAGWLEDSRLVAAGLAEPRALARAWLSPGTLPAHEGPPAEASVTLESWLRALERHPAPRYLEEHTHEPEPATEA